MRKDLEKKLMQICALESSKRYGVKMLHGKNLLEMAAAVMTLFPKSYPEEAILVQRTPVRRGLLYNACAYLKSQLFAPKPKESGEELSSNAPEDDPDFEMAPSPENIVEQLKYAMAADVTTIKIGLTQTFKYRSDLLIKSEKFPDNLIFQFYWINPKVFINHEFSLRYKKTNINALLEYWPRASSVMTPLLFLHKKQMCKEDVPPEILSFMNFIKILGHLPAKRKRNVPNDNFLTTCSRLVKFYKVDESEEEILSKSRLNTQPFLVGKYTEATKEIQQYFLVYDPSVFPLPLGFDFLDAIDILYKIYHIFILDFPPSLQRLYSFFDQFVFGIGSQSITNNLKVFSQIQNELTKINAVHGPASDNEPPIEIIVETEEELPPENGQEYETPIDTQQENEASENTESP